MIHYCNIIERVDLIFHRQFMVTAWQNCHFFLLEHVLGYIELQ